MLEYGKLLRSRYEISFGWWVVKGSATCTYLLEFDSSRVQLCVSFWLSSIPLGAQLYILHFQPNFFIFEHV